MFISENSLGMTVLCSEFSCVWNFVHDKSAWTRFLSEVNSKGFSTHMNCADNMPDSTHYIIQFIITRRHNCFRLDTALVLMQPIHSSTQPCLIYNSTTIVGLFICKAFILGFRTCASCGGDAGRYTIGCVWLRWGHVQHQKNKSRVAESPHGCLQVLLFKIRRLN